MQLLNKISVATVVGNIKAIVKTLKEGESKAVMRIFGIANGTQTGESDMGPWTALKGEFKVKNLLTNKEFISGKCFLPRSISELIEGQLGDGQKVQFAFDIIVVEDESSQVGYHYTAEPLIKPQENNALALLENQVNK